MARIDNRHYLAVHDFLAFEEGNRLSVIEISKNLDVIVSPVSFSNWSHVDGKPSDLEGACSIPGRSGEFLLVEAGHWDSNYGRMFHVEIDKAKAPHQGTVLGVFDLPEFNAKGPGDDVGDEI